MSDRCSGMPREEVTATMISTALGEVEKIMTERGLGQDDVTSEFLTEGVDRLWSSEDREGLRTKAYAAVSDYVDRLFDNIEGPRVPSAFPEMETPVFAAKAHALISKEERAYQDWLATGSLDMLISEAIRAGKDAFVTMPDDDTKPATWAVIDLGHRRAKPLVLALRGRGLGALNAVDLTYVIRPHEITKVTDYNSSAHSAAIEAFAMKLSAPGFEISIMHGAAQAAAA